MSALGWIVLAFLGLVTSARTRLTATILGQPVSVPALWLAAAVIMLVLAGVVLLLIRQGRTEGWLRLRPVVVTT